MSDQMSVTDAQAYLGAWSTGDSVDMWKVRAARTVVAQAEQIERLQRAMRKTIEYNYESVEDLMAAHILLPGDMEDQND